MAGRSRLDLALVERGLAPSREKARALILAGEVTVDGQRADKPGLQIAASAALEVRATHRYVSRGGEKLQSAWEAFGFEVAGKVCLDVGASTGGFTDFLLQKGALRVYAVDVGYGQLAWSLRNDPRVVVLERVNARHMEPELLPVPAALAALDVSFISLEKVLPAVLACLAPTAELVALVKPQFEAGPDAVGKKGVVRDAAVHESVLSRCAAHAAEQGLQVRGATFSALQGPEGNIEFFLYLARPAAVPQPPPDLAAVVARAHEFFGR